jgi:hypothetical protein
MIDSQIKTYLQNQSGYKKKWQEYLVEAPNLDLSHRVDALTPFSSTPDFSDLSEKNKDDLFINNVRLLAEALIVFEQILLLGFVVNRHKPENEKENFSGPFRQFSFEELYHLMAFRNFLSKHEVFSRFPKPLLTDCHWIKNAFTLIVRNFPGALYICSPRLESQALSYYNEIKRAYAGHPDNSLLKLHRLHYQDEVFHIPLNYHFHNELIAKNGVVKTFLGSMLFIMLMQVMMLRATFETISQSFPEKSLFGKWKWTFKFIRWYLSVSESHKGSKNIMLNHINKINPRYKHLFSFLTK